METGITLVLDGSEDHHLRRQCKVFWDELDMSGIRGKIKAEIDMAVVSFQLVSWNQWEELLESMCNAE